MWNIPLSLKCDCDITNEVSHYSNLGSEYKIILIFEFDKSVVYIDHPPSWTIAYQQVGLKNNKIVYFRWKINRTIKYLLK